jgi:putative peptidoglycan lipid II flippase
MRRSLSVTLRGILLLSVPASLGLILLRKPIITLLYQRGEFTSHSTNLVAWALLWYAAGLVGHAMVEILSRAFYDLYDTKTPVFIGIAAMSLNVLFSFLFSAGFSRLGWMPHGGLALANTLATALEMVGLLVIMRKRLNGLDGKRIWSGLLKASVAGLLMAIALWKWIPITSNNSIWIQGAVGILVGLLVYIVGLLILRTEELKQVFQAVRARLG